MSDDKPYTIKVEVPTHLDKDDNRGYTEIAIDAIASIFENISSQLRLRRNTGDGTKSLPSPQENSCDNEEVVVYKDRPLDDQEWLECEEIYEEE